MFGYLVRISLKKPNMCSMSVTVKCKLLFMSLDPPCSQSITEGITYTGSWIARGDVNTQTNGPNFLHHRYIIQSASQRLSADKETHTQ